MLQRRAAVVGAGIGGLAAAVALRRAGWSVRVFERAASPRELGFALSLAPNAMAALRELGLAERVRAEGHEPALCEVRRADGRRLRRIDARRVVAERADPSVVALRPVVHGALLDAVGRNDLVLDAEVVAFDAAADGVTLTLRDGRTETADLLVGADGVRSVVRRLLHPDEDPPRRSAYCAVRGVARGAADRLGELSVVLYLGRGVEAATAKAGQGAVYWYLSVLAEDVSDGLRAPRDVVDRFLPRMDARYRDVVDATAPEDLRFDELFDRDPIDDWGSGPATLLGDAAHPMLPHSGQGAAQALEDAVALGLATTAGDDLAAALRRYERVRSARTRRIVRLGRRIARTTTTKNPVVRFLRTAALRCAPRAALVAAFDPGVLDDPHRALRASRT